MKTLVLLAAAGAVAATAAAANSYEPAMRKFLETEAAQWLDDSVLIEAIRSQNARTAAFDQAQIDTLDQTWRAEVGKDSAPTIDPVLHNPASDFLRQQVEASGGRITEVFVMDGRGLNVATSGVTSDYWQGDEDKFTATHGVGAGAMHFGEIEFDESSQTYQGQISMTITDPDTGQPIGAVTIGVDAESLL